MQFDVMIDIVEANLIALTTEPMIGQLVSDALVGVYINEGYHKVNAAMRWPWLYKEGTDTLSVSSTSLSVPADTGLIVAAYNQTIGQSMLFLDYEQGWVDQPNAIQSEGPASHYYRKGDTWFVWPNPTSADTILLKYLRTVADLATTDEPDGWPDAFHHILLDYATWKAITRLTLVAPQYANQGAAAANRFYEDFQTGLALMQNSYLTDKIGDVVWEDDIMRDVYAGDW